MIFVTFTGTQNIISRRSAIARPPKKTFVGVVGRSRGQRVEASMILLPERNYGSLPLDQMFET